MYIFSVPIEQFHNQFIVYQTFMLLDIIKELSQAFKIPAEELKEKEQALLAYLEEKPESDNEELLFHLYGGGSNNRIYLHYLQQDLLNKFQNQVLQDAPKGKLTSTQRNYFECHKLNATAYILLGQNQRNAAVKAADLALRRAFKYDFTDIIVSTATLLRRHYGVIVGDKIKMYSYHDTVETYSKIKALEEKVEFYYIDVRSHFPQSKKVTSKLIEKAQRYVEEIKPHIGRTRSYRFHVLSYSLIMAVAQMQAQPIEIVNVGQKALRYFDNQIATTVGVYFIFNYDMIPALIQLGEFEQATQTIKSCLNISNKGSHNWVITMQYQIIAHFYSQEFEQAWELIKETKPQAKKHDNLYEMWVILEAYAAFLTGQKFRLQKFLNEVPTYEKDKRGMNINILIIQILYSLQRKKYEQIVEKVEAIRSYSYKYLREDETYRSNCFIRMLLTLKPCRFKRSMVEKRAAELLEKMSAAPIRDIDMEPVRYEVLWGKVLELLK